MLVVLCCFDVCFILRDFLPNRELASMIHWTLVVAYTMFTFILIHSFLFFGFAFAFYIQLHVEHTANLPEIAQPVASSNGTEEEENDAFNGGINLPFKVR